MQVLPASGDRPCMPCSITTSYRGTAQPGKGPASQQPSRKATPEIVHSQARHQQCTNPRQTNSRSPHWPGSARNTHKLCINHHHIGRPPTLKTPDMVVITMMYAVMSPSNNGAMVITDRWCLKNFLAAPGDTPSFEHFSLCMSCCR